MTKGMFGRIAMLRFSSGVSAVVVAFIALFSLLLGGEARASDAILIDFSSTHCGPCRAMEPIIAQLEQRGVPVRHVNVDTERNLAIRYGIRQTPTFVVLVGGKEVTRLVGMQSAGELQRALATQAGGPLIATGSDVPQARSTRSLRDELPPVQTRLAPARRLADGRSSVQLATAPAPHRQSEPLSSITIAKAIERAHAATVRLKVHDGHGYGAGTGTIIDTHGDEALVLTCGHLFRENQGKGKVEVDLFVGGQVRTVLGKVLDYDSENRDIAIVVIRPGFPVQPVPILSKGLTVRTGQQAFSFGCDRGDDPSRRDTRVTGVDKYNTHLGASNIEIAGAPVDGRSGGGLFDDQGRLIGVCNAADYKGNVGIYTGPGSVQWQLDRMQLQRLYEAPTLVNNQRPDPRALANQTPPERLASAGRGQRLDNSVVQASATAPRAGSRSPSNVGAASGNREVIVIVRDPANPNGSSRVMTLTRPTAQLMQMIEQQSH